MPWSWFKQPDYESVNLVTSDKEPVGKGSPSFKTAFLESIMGQAGSVSFEERVVHTVQESEQPILNCEVSPDGKIVAACSTDGTIYLWNLSTGELLRSLKGHNDEVTSCAFSGPILATASKDGVVILWHYNTGKRASRLAVHAGPVYDCVFSKEGCALATCSKDTTVRHFKIKPGSGEFVPGTNIRVLSGRQGHRAPVNTVAFSLDNKFIFSGSEDGVIKKWSCCEGKCLETLDDRTFGPVKSIRFAPMEEVFVSLSKNSLVVWNMGDTSEVRQVIDVQGRQIQAINFVPDSNYLVGVTWDRLVTIWEPICSNAKPIISCFGTDEDPINGPVIDSLHIQGEEDWDSPEASSPVVFQLRLSLERPQPGVDWEIMLEIMFDDT